MKIADSETIKLGEAELIETLKEKLNIKAIESIAAKNFNVSEIDCAGGDIVIHNGAIAYRFDLEAKVSVSVLFDRQGNAIEPLSESVQEPEEESVLEPVSENESDELLNEGMDFDPIDEAPVESAEEKEPSVNESALPGLDLVLKKNRDFWLEESSEEEKNSTDELESILKKNREFWNA
jgi:hypothetical protein